MSPWWREELSRGQRGSGCSSHELGPALSLWCSRRYRRSPNSRRSGTHQIASGAAFIVRAGGLVQAQAGQAVLRSRQSQDGCRRPPRDHHSKTTRASRSVPAAEVRLDRFVYAPAEGRLGFVLNVVRGVMAYVSGRIAKLSPDSIRLKRRPPLSASAERHWRFASCRNESACDARPIPLVAALTISPDGVGAAARSVFAPPTSAAGRA